MPRCHTIAYAGFLAIALSRIAARALCLALFSATPYVSAAITPLRYGHGYAQKLFDCYH